jgi:DNA-binding response OmpR family regulator
MSNALCAILKHNNYSVDAVFDGQEALRFGLCCNYDCMILDIMMPKMDGLTVLKQLRAENVTAPVLLLTAKSELDDRVMGLDTGADDYLCKPFAMTELLAVLRAMTRRKSDFAPNVLSNGNITLSILGFELSNGETSFRLGNKEFQLMDALMTGFGRWFSQEQLMERIWGINDELELTEVDVYISYLRKKLTALDSQTDIQFLPDTGYRLGEKI